MRIVLISEIFCREMGYLENLLPKYLARQGAKVEVVASSLPPDYRQASSENAYKGFANAWIPGTCEILDGFRLHILPPAKVAGHVRLMGLRHKLAALRPDIVQTMTPIGWIAVDASWNRIRLGYRLFSGCHYHASVFPLAQKHTSLINPERLKCFLQRTIHGRIASVLTDKCYAISVDCAEIARRFFGVPEKKIVVCPLGVDTEMFYPVRGPGEESARTKLRSRFGFCEKDVVCIYAGRFGEDKNPLLLAKAIARLSTNGYPFKGMFVGNGQQASAIGDCPGCFTHPFVPISELGDFYRSADIGVWPTQDSISMLDAAACGLPVIANDKMRAIERLEGNGLAYRLHDLDDLVRTLFSLLDPDRRRRLGSFGARKMEAEYSWRAVAVRRLHDYEAALRSERNSSEARTLPSSQNGRDG
jgi:glycosyltransferase involved in cell wall biosynthesis